METRDLVVKIDNSIAINEETGTKLIESAYNLNSRLMSLKQIAQMENVNTLAIYGWCRANNYIGWDNYVTEEAYLSWMTKTEDNVFEWEKDDILLQNENGSSVYVNTSSKHYGDFIQKLRNSKLTEGYNLGIKETRIEIPKYIRRSLIKKGIKLRERRVA